MTAEALVTDTFLQRFGAGLPRPMPNRPAVAAVLPVQIRVAVLGDDPLARDGIAHCLAETTDVRIVNNAAGAQLVILLIHRVGESAEQLIRSINQPSGPAIVLVVAELENHRVAGVLAAGAVGIIRRADVSRSKLRRVIRSVLAGEAVVPPDVLTGLVAQRPAVDLRGRAGTAALTQRESKVLALLADGSDTREVAHRLCYSERTVKAIIQDITLRFGLRNRSHAVAYALRMGLI